MDKKNPLKFASIIMVIGRNLIKCKTYTSKNDYSNQYILTTPGKILFNQLIQKL
jgi:hypothetical protein